jgi:hypothetical protein
MLASKVIADISGVKAAGTFDDIDLDSTVAFTPDGASTIIAVVPAESERGGTSSSLCISWSTSGEAKTKFKGFSAKTRCGKKATVKNVKTIMRQFILIIFFHSILKMSIINPFVELRNSFVGTKIHSVDNGLIK